MLDDDGEEEREAINLLEILKEEEMLWAVKERQLKEGAKAFSQTILDERATKAENWHRDAAVKARYTQPAQPITCATFAQDVLEGRTKVSQAHNHKHVPMTFGPASLVGGSLTSERERMRAQVFQPGHRLPTMSIEEARLKEMEIMNIWQERNAELMEKANSAWYRDNPKSKLSEDDDDDNVQKKEHGMTGKMIILGVLAIRSSPRVVKVGGWFMYLRCTLLNRAKTHILRLRYCSYKSWIGFTVPVFV